MSNNLITIQEAADLTQKSIQTIRRAIKSKKIKFRRDKTPQGFNYLIDKDSVFEFYGMQASATQPQAAAASAPAQAPTTEPVAFQNDETMNVNTHDFKAFVQTMQTMISQHSEERQSFLRLVNTMQEKIFILENQINLLKAPQVKKWYQLWKSKV
ncbi:MAG: helix-turn-helix domain-containing protein [Candidatus Peregrinibacteria bacterium]|nr:helix-turn-helix domain-containing protein [Candidatus Peregrinibacteria bacterium]